MLGRKILTVAKTCFLQPCWRGGSVFVDSFQPSHFQSLELSKTNIKNTCRFSKPVLLGIDINSQIYDSDFFAGWCLGLKGGKHSANFTNMAKCVSELGIVLPAGDLSKHSNVSEYGTYNPTVGNHTIVIDQIGTIGHTQVLPNSICSDPGLIRALNVGKEAQSSLK